MLVNKKRLLQGETEAQNLSDYNRILLSDTKYIMTFFENYPCLLRILSNEIRKSRKFILELLKRYQDDQLEISQHLCCNTALQKIRQIDIGLGDAHCDGRKTAKIHLERKAIFYKTRNLSPQSLYAELIQEWNTNTIEQYTVKTPKSIVKNEYGWIEDIQYQGCSKREEIHTFYKRMGIQMAFLYALNATDFHFENLIAQKDYPILIDLECLFHIPLDIPCNIHQTKNLQEKLKYSVATSVYSLGILPAFCKESHMDISGLGKDEQIQSFSKISKLNVDQMKINKDYVWYTPSEEHRPRIAGKRVLLYPYKEDIKQGFTMAYTYIQHHKKEILRILEGYKELLITRYVPKPTQTYATILDLSLHPRFLHNSLDRELFIAKFCEEGDGSACSLLGRAEFVDLMNGDIPYFASSISSKNLISSRGSILQDFFSVSPYQFVQQKIEDFNNRDLQFQLQIIENSLELTQQASKQEPVTKSKALNLTLYMDEFKKKNFFIEKAKNIAEYIYTLAYIEDCENKKQISWVNMILNKKTFDIQAMNDNLYDGLSGMALMYASLWYVTKETKYWEIAENIMTDIMGRVERVSIEESKSAIGAFNGIASILYTMLNFYIFTQNKKYKKCIQKMIRIMQQHLQEDSHLDIISGTAGALIVLIRYYELEKEPRVLDVAKQCGTFLINNISYFNEQALGWIGISKKALTGFSHGNAGIVYALHLLNNHLQSDSIHTVIKKGIIFENNNRINGQWLDLRLEDRPIDSCKWCHGSPGILISRLELQKSKDRDISTQSKIDIQYAINNLLKYDFTTMQNGKNICHGVIGNALILMKYGQETQNFRLENASKNLLYENVKKFNITQWEQMQEHGIQGVGLLTGLAGIAYGLLYACDQRLPNVTTLELGKLTV
ncbi:type 2 lanthipeptide synthetase LanM [Bacillus toyonensis]|uniref:Type 2 lantipeptide synthetase LanM n=1 Tax=Bacillus toyonensis TaxID=155322 RepID=A0A2A8H9U4_9BACI|nr:type 2 lanthipeptide synthetase LanM [Bacillus toyonensis]PEP96969.1 type 2 lantipeptide synthetase LanM [Bacillus toyonensis]